MPHSSPLINCTASLAAPIPGRFLPALFVQLGAEVSESQPNFMPPCWRLLRLPWPNMQFASHWKIWDIFLPPIWYLWRYQATSPHWQSPTSRHMEAICRQHNLSNLAGEDLPWYWKTDLILGPTVVQFHTLTGQWLFINLPDGVLAFCSVSKHAPSLSREPGTSQAGRSSTSKFWIRLTVMSTGSYRCINLQTADQSPLSSAAAKSPLFPWFGAQRKQRNS